MSRGKKLLLMVTVLVVIGGFYYYISNKPAKHNEETEPVEHIESITLHDFESSEIERLLLKKKDENILLINGETPTIDGLSDVKLNTVKLHNIFNNFASLTADQLVEKDAKDIAKYGLDKPNVSITADIKGKDPIILHVGNKTVDGRNCYVRLDEDNTVYLINSYVGNYFIADTADLRDTSLPNIDPQFIQYLYIGARGNKPIEIIYKTDIEKKAAYGIGLYSLVQPYEIPKEINYLKYDEIIKGIPKFTAEKFVDDQPVDLAAYGLDNPVLRLKMKSKNEEMNNISKEVDILFGDTFDENYIYFKYADTNNVYGMEKDFMEPLLNVTPYDIVDKFIYIVNIKEIKELEISINNSSYIFEIKGNTSKDEEKEKVEQAFFYKDNELDEEIFRELYQLIIGISADAEVNQVNDAIGNDGLKITYTFNDDTKESITYMSYSDLFYYHQMEDNVYFLSSSKQVDSIIDKIEEIINK